MASKYMKKCSKSLAKKEMQINTTVRFHLAPVRMTVNKKTSKSKHLTGCGRKKNPHTLRVRM
jgi:hypothetical protein